MKKLIIQDVRSPQPPEYETGVPTTRPRHFVSRMIRYCSRIKKPFQISPGNFEKNNFVKDT
jgi:hypothetical protein